MVSLPPHPGKRDRKGATAADEATPESVCVPSTGTGGGQPV